MGPHHDRQAGHQGAGRAHRAGSSIPGASSCLALMPTVGQLRPPMSICSSSCPSRATTHRKRSRFAAASMRPSRSTCWPAHPSRYAGASSKATSSCATSHKRARCCMNPLTVEWVAKAESDLASALRDWRARKAPNYDAACFHAQQCTEKYLKALLQENNIALSSSVSPTRHGAPGARPRCPKGFAC